MRYGMLWSERRSLAQRSRTLVLSLCAAMALCWLFVWRANAAGSPTGSTAGAVVLKLSLLAENGKISAHEPLLARVDIVNGSSEGIALLKGISTAPTMHWVIRDGEGTEIAATPKPIANTSGIQGVLRLAPGATDSRIWVVSGLYRFEKPGQYSVSVQQLQGAENTVVAEDTATLEVLPFDGARLDAKCSELLAPIQKGTAHLSGVPMSVRTMALYSVRDEIALPYLEWLVREQDAKYAARAIYEVGTDRAISLFNQLASRQDKAGEQARRAAQIPDAVSRDILWRMAGY